MNTQPQPAEFAMALYATACETHQRRDWRTACHALHDALRLELLRTAAIPAPAHEAAPAPKATARPARTASKAATPLAFTMTAESLSKALRLACRVVEKRHTIPILAQVLLQARGDVLVITATDLDREMVLHVTAPDLGTWEATADAHALKDLLAKAKGPVAIVGETTDVRRKDGGFLTRVTLSGAVSATLQGLPPADFPVVKAEALAGMHPVTITPAALADALAFTRHAISTEETRYYLNGVSLKLAGPGKLAFCATDGSRLNLVEPAGKVKLHDPKGAGYIVPRSAVLDMLELVRGAPEADLGISPAMLQLVSGAVVYTSKMIDGNFPDYRRVIPADGDGARVTFDAAALHSTVAKVSAISSEKARTVKLTFVVGAVEISCRNMEGASSSEVVACDGDAGALVISFNAGFLRDAVAALDCKRVTLVLHGPSDPLRVESADKGADGRLCVVMPLRT